MPSIVPNFFRTLASGIVQAVFPGGVEILAADITTPANEREIRWVRESDGALVMEIQGFNGIVAPPGFDLSAGGIDVESQLPANIGNRSQMSVRSSGKGGNFAGVDSTVIDQPGGSRTVRAFTDITQAQIIDEGGRSDFLQIPPTASAGRMGIVAGLVSGAGAINFAYPANSYSVSRVGVGVYNINWNVAWSASPVLVPVRAGTAALVMASFLSAGPVTTQAQTYNSSTGAAADNQFSFLAVGPMS